MVMDASSVYDHQRANNTKTQLNSLNEESKIGLISTNWIEKVGLTIMGGPKQMRHV
jgi:hypothetical protein